MDNTKRKYLFLRWLPPNGEWGGMEKLILEWFARIDYKRAHIVLAVMPSWEDRFKKEISRLNLPVEVIIFPFEFTQKKFLRFKYFYSFFKSIHPHTIVFVQGLYTEFHLGDVIAAFLASKGNVFMHENLGAPKPTEKTSRLYFGFIKGAALWWHKQRFYINARAYFCKSILVVSQSIQKRLVDSWGYPKSKVKVTYHGVLPDQFKPSEEVRKRMRRELSISDSTPVIIVTARLAQQKRIDRLLEAFIKAALDFKEVQLVIAGTGPLESELKNKAADSPCANRIRFIGQVSNVPDYLRMADFYILSSDNEGLSIALMEAMSAGLVCISTDCPGSNEVITNEVNGFLVPMSVEGVFSGLHKALSLSINERRDISLHAQRTIKEKFDIDRNIKNIFIIMDIPVYVF